MAWLGLSTGGGFGHAASPGASTPYALLLLRKQASLPSSLFLFSSLLPQDLLSEEGSSELLSLYQRVGFTVTLMGIAGALQPKC